MSNQSLTSELKKMLREILENCVVHGVYRAKADKILKMACGNEDEKQISAPDAELLECLDGLLADIRDFFGWDGGMIDDDNGVEYFVREYRRAELALKKARGEK